MEPIEELDIIEGTVEIPTIENPENREFENIEIETEGGK